MKKNSFIIKIPKKILDKKYRVCCKLCNKDDILEQHTAQILNISGEQHALVLVPENFGYLYRQNNYQKENFDIFIEFLHNKKIRKMFIVPQPVAD